MEAAVAHRTAVRLEGDVIKREHRNADDDIVRDEKIRTREVLNGKFPSNDYISSAGSAAACHHSHLANRRSRNVDSVDAVIVNERVVERVAVDRDAVSVCSCTCYEFSERKNKDEAK